MQLLKIDVLRMQYCMVVKYVDFVDFSFFDSAIFWIIFRRLLEFIFKCVLL